MKMLTAALVSLPVPQEDASSPRRPGHRKEYINKCSLEGTI